MEAELKGSPLVDNICVVADSRFNHVVALIVANQVELRRLAKDLGIESPDNNNLIDNEKVVKEVLSDLMKFARKVGLNKSETPKSIKLVQVSLIFGLISGLIC